MKSRDDAPPGAPVHAGDPADAANAAGPGDRASDENAREDALIEAARGARERAYAPYSNYLVGCALCADGRTFVGANVENASYGLTICAERVACAGAALAGARHIDVVVVMTSASPPAAPCGMCLQTLTEFSRDPRATRIILVNGRGERRELALADMLPNAFDRSQLTS